MAQGYSCTSPNSFTPLGALLPQTSNTLSWALYHLSRDPGIQETLYQELKAVVPPDRFPGPEDIPKMPMLRAIIKETLRYSPALSLPQGSSHWPFPEGQGQPLLPPRWGCTNPGGWCWETWGMDQAGCKAGFQLLGRGMELLSSRRCSTLSCLQLLPPGAH